MSEYRITDFGAVGDGVTDCTAAIQTAIDKAAAEVSGGLVLVPPGVFRTGTVKLCPHVSLQGTAGWGFRSLGGSVLQFNGSGLSLVDITGALGCRVSGLCLDGGKLGKNTHGILFGRENFFDHPEEDAFIVEDTQIRHFSGTGMYLQYACCFSVRHCHIIENSGDGIFLNSWDAFILDNQISGNGGWGIRSASMGVNNSALTLTGNRVEWNHLGGFYLRHARLWNMTGNYFDRSGGPAIHIDRSLTAAESGDARWRKLPCQSITITGNVFNRSGADFGGNLDTLSHCHLRLHECFGVTVTGNTFLVGMDDGWNDGRRSPEYALVIEKLKGCVIMGNTWWKGFLNEGIHDLGGHGDGVIIANNAGYPVPEADIDPDGHMSVQWEN